MQMVMKEQATKNIDILHIDSMQAGLMSMWGSNVELLCLPVLSAVSGHIFLRLEMKNILNLLVSYTPTSRPWCKVIHYPLFTFYISEKV